MQLTNKWLILFFVAVGLSAKTQPLDTLLLELRQSNPDLKALEKTYRADYLISEQVDDWPDTEFGAGLGLLPTETRLGPQQLKVSVTQMLPWPGIRDARRALASAKAETVPWQRSARALELERLFAEAYYRQYQLEKSDRILAEQLRILDRLRALLLEQVAAGRQSTTALLRIDLRRSELEQQRRILENRQSEPQAIMQQLLAREAPVQVPDTLTPAVLPAGNITASDHPDIRQLQQRREIARREIALTELNARPSIGVGLDYFLVGKRADASPTRNGRDILSPRVMLTVPLGADRFSARTEEQQVRIAALKDQQQATILALRQKAVQARTDHREALLRLELYREQRRILRETLALEIRALSTGETPLEEILELYATDLTYQLQALEAIVDTYRALALYRSIQKT